jgi:hypothetical protein
MGVEMPEPWMWCTCTNARVWCESMASSSRWLHDLVDAAGEDFACEPQEDPTLTESTSAAGGAVSGAIIGTTTTRIPPSWSASNSW